MNYTIDANINFFDELLKNDEEEDKTIETECCLITDKPLTENYITLNCNHKFNYEAIYNEVVNQKTKYNPNEIMKLKMSEIKCPYCRQITSNILPYIPSISSSKKIIGVTIPNKYSLSPSKCDWVFKSGKNKGNLCGCNAFSSEHGKLCEKHWNMKNKNKSLESSEWNPEMQKLYDSMKLHELRDVLRNKNMKVSGNKRELVLRIMSKS